MASMMHYFLIMASLLVLSHAQLSPTFYDATCPNAVDTVRTSIRQAVSRERRMAASLIRLHFHDCFVQGCDGSLLLNDTTTFRGEQSAGPNRNSVRGFQVIEAAKVAVERACPGVVSCADILTLAARDASDAVNGPSWTVRLGRRDSTDANFDLANADLPAPFSDVREVFAPFERKGFTLREMVALSGAHTIGQAKCSEFRNHIYRNRTYIDPGFASTRKRSCPETTGDGNLAPLDLVTPNSFDNNYFMNLQSGRGLLHSDQVLFGDASTRDMVVEYGRNPRVFDADFASAMVKMSELSPLVGGSGIIRRVCSAIN